MNSSRRNFIIGSASIAHPCPGRSLDTLISSEWHIIGLRFLDLIHICVRFFSEIQKCGIFWQNEKERENLEAWVCLCIAALLDLLFKISFSVLPRSALVKDKCWCPAVTGQNQPRACVCTLQKRPVMGAVWWLPTKNPEEAKLFCVLIY